MGATFWNFPEPGARLYCIAGVVLTVYFVGTLVQAIQLSTRLHESGSTGWSAFGSVAGAYAWNTNSRLHRRAQRLITLQAAASNFADH